MRWINQTWIGLAVLVMSAACGSTAESAPDPEYAALTAPSVREPTSDLEREVLSKLGELEPGASVEIGGHTLVAGAPYHAASGRVCRTLSLSDSTVPRLACQIDGDWAFVPDVVGGGSREAAP